MYEIARTSAATVPPGVTKAIYTSCVATPQAMPKGTLPKIRPQIRPPTNGRPMV